MATVRSSMPSRLRQLLSGESMIGPSLKVDTDPPGKVKAFIDKVIQSPLHDIAIPLFGFRWEYGKGNFHHWRPLFLHFDTYFKTYLANRNDLLLTNKISQEDIPFPKYAVIQILRVMQTILENCHNKSAFDGLEHFKLLLASTDPEVLIATLETLATLVKINPSKLHGSGKVIGCGSVNSYLLSLAQGWGSKEEGLGLYSCVLANERSRDGLSLFPSEKELDDNKVQHRIGSTLYFELHGSSSSVKNEGIEASGARVINIPDLHLSSEDDFSLLRQCVEQYNVPEDLRFALLTRIRYAKAFHSLRTCRLYSRICLLAFIVLVQSSDANEYLTSFFANEPEYTNELIRIVRSAETIPTSIRTLAMLALGAQLAAYSASHDRARILSGSSISFAVGNRMILLNVLQKAVISLKSSNDRSSFSFVEALLQFYLLHIVSSSASGGNVRGSGMVPTFLPLLENSDPSHLHLVYLAVKALQKLMDYSSSSISLLRELGGVDLLSHRLQIEVQRIIDIVDDNSNVVGTGESSRQSEEQMVSRKRLIKVLLKALGSATYVPSSNTRAINSHESSLPSTLSLIYEKAEKFGGDIYYSAVTVMSEIIHKDPTCFSHLQEMGLPDAFLSSVAAGILPSSKALTCVPNGIGALCLNAKGLEAVKETSSLRFLVDICTSKKYVLAMNEAIVPLANAVEELLRHVSSLRSVGVEIIIEIIDKIASFECSNLRDATETECGSTSMDLDFDKENDGHCSIGDRDDSTAGVKDEQFVHFCIFHLMVLLHRTMENSETCRLFVEKSGIEALLKLLLRPSIIQSSEGMCIALHSTLVFKGFTQHHSATLARAFTSCLRDHISTSLGELRSKSGLFLLDPKGVSDGKVFSSLFLVEFLLFLAASKDNRWVNALLTEFGNDSKDSLEDIGCLHREVLWQLSLLEDSKADSDDAQSTVPESQQSENGTYESEEQRFNSFRQFLDPLLRRRTLGWSIESQFFDLINLYRDLGRATAIQQRLITDDSFSRAGAVTQHHHSENLDATTSGSTKENEKQKSFYNSCCDMVRSLSFHITHLFQELGKAMLLPSRRREDAVNVSQTSKVVASTFASVAIGHMEFGGNVTVSGLDASVSSKCRYYGKVINFIDVILLDRPDSFNPILLNYFYGRGVIKFILTTFNATSQLPFIVNRPLTSPMETDDGNVKSSEKDVDLSWMYGPLASYGRLLDHLVTSSFILSPFTKHLLVQPLVSGGVPYPRDAETFVKALQSLVLKALLPIWTHPQFADCSNEFIGTVISIIRHVYSGIEVKSASSAASNTRITGPPPNEAAITTIVEMGFSRSRAEEALRQVGSNSVELAMEWLFSHPEETHEDDELARALAMSLGNSESDTRDDTENTANQQLEEDMVELPPVEELLSTCGKLLEVKEPLAFSVRDLLVLISSQNDGQHRQSVVTFILDQIRGQSITGSVLCTLFHVLALILNEDIVARDVASKCGLVKIVLDLLSLWDSESMEGDGSNVPKWVTTAFLAIDQLLQVNKKINSETIEMLTKTCQESSQQVANVERQSKGNAMELYANHMSTDEQKALIQISCSCIRKQLPSETMHAVFQLCSSLTRNHPIAVCFLENDGISLLLSLPPRCLFPGFDNVAATIIRHILEDPQTLQQAMESEIKHKFASAANRHANGRFTPRNFLLSLNSVIVRDPIIFMRASQAVCQIEMVGDRPYVVLMKDREKERIKDKEKEKEKDKVEKDKSPMSDGKIRISGKKMNDSSLKCPKVHRRCPQSFNTVIELLLDSIASFEPPKNDVIAEDPNVVASSSCMDIDSALKGKGKAIVGTSEEHSISSHEASASLAMVGFILKVLTEIVLMYSAAVHVILRRDAEISSNKGVSNQKAFAGQCSGFLLHHILNKFVPHSKVSKKDKRTDSDWRHKLASRATQFLVASCVRSSEARRRVFTEISYILNNFVNSSDVVKPPTNDIHMFVDLLNDILTARTPTGANISSEASASFIEVGLVKSCTRMLDVLDFDHVDSTKVVTGLVKAMELVTKEHAVSSIDSSLQKGESAVKPPAHRLSGQPQSISDVPRPTGSNLQPNHGSMASENIDTFDIAPVYSRSEAVTDDMEHDQDLDGGFPSSTADDDYMQEDTEDIRVVENGMGTIGIEFEIQPPGGNAIDDDTEDEDEEDEMSGDEGDDVDEEEEDGDERHNDLEDGVHHLSHYDDTDQDDHDIEDDEFDEEVLEEDDEDEEEDDDGVILRLEDNGINVFDHIEVFGRDTFNNDALHVMPVEIFDSRRQGRTTSIYNLLGRGSDGTSLSRHPLLSGPSTQPTRSRQSDRNTGAASSQLETIFRSLRSGRNGQRFNFWADENPQSNGFSTILPQGLEDLLVSQLRGPLADATSDQNNQNAEPKHSNEAIISQEPEVEVHGNHADNVNDSHGNQNIPPSTTLADGSDGNCNVQTQPLSSEAQPQATEMQYEQTDGTARDVEAVSQESGGSGATIGESLRSLDVEIGSADGHDEGGERHGSSDRVHFDPHISRARRGVSFGTASGVSGRDASLHSVSEVPENSREADNDGSGAEQHTSADSGSSSIDPAFLDALPEELRAEVLSAQQNQVAQPSNAEVQNVGEIDPEFLAALPPDIRAEVLAQQQSQRVPQSHELEGQPVEMDTVSIIATFPSDLREEVLLTSSDAILANLTPALVAEANMLRERFAHRYRNRALFGMIPRSRRGDTSRRGEGSTYSMERGGVNSRRAVTPKLVEADGAPLVESESLQSMVRVLQIVQPIYKGPLQRLLLNLCAHNETRIALVKILMSMLILDRSKSTNLSRRPEPVYRLYACQSNVMYSRAQSFDGVPPLVSRRVLETLTYLANNHLYVARILLHYRTSLSLQQKQEGHVDKKSGKAVISSETFDNDQSGGCASISLLLSLLNQPLYLRSIAHLEQLLKLLEVIINNAEKTSGVQERTEFFGDKPPATNSEPLSNVESGVVSTNVASSSSPAAGLKTSGSSVNEENIVHDVLSNLPHAELRVLSSLLAREGLSDNAYTLVAEVMKRLVAIAPIHCHLFITELASAVQSLTKSAMNELQMFGEAVKALLSTSSCDGAAILRVLQALSSLVSSLVEKQKDQKILSDNDYTAVVPLVCNINSALEPLWLELSSCISKIESYSDPSQSTGHSRPSSSKHSGVMPPLPAGSQNILPYIESFFVMCEKLHTVQPGSSNDYNSVAETEETDAFASKQKNVTPSLKMDEKNIAFVRFSEKHRKLLNAFIRQNPGLLDKSFSLMLKVPRFVDFDNKRAHFRSKIKHHHENHHHHSPLRISVRRAYILEDSYNQLRMRPTQDLKGRLTVHFQGEEGIDAGGLTREWYQLLSRVIFDKNALLFTTVGNDSTFQPNPNSVYQTEHLSYFKFVGRVVGKALFDGQLLDVHFTRSFYKHILGVKVTYHDIEAIEPDFFKNLKWMLENDISDVLDLTFSIDADEEKRILCERTEVTDHELIPGGRNIKVTEENKHQYVDLMTEHRLTTAIRPQINAFLEGFNELIPRDLIAIFNDKELELLISGLPDIDLDDMRANTEYSGYSGASQIIQWFWEVVQGFSKEDKARLLQFVTGTSKVPLEGFSALQGISGSQKFQIHKAYGSANHLPTAHTCFNQLDMPEYPSKDHLEERLLFAIHEGNEGFGFG